MIIRCVLFSLLIGLLLPVAAQRQLEQYIQQGLQSNTALKQLDFQLQAAQAALAEAEANRSVGIDLLSQYTLAAGGRAIDVPIGDLLNPVYSTLNELTNTMQFPQVENASELLNPNNFYDVKMRVTYPVINPSIDLNNDIKSLQQTLAAQDITIYKQELSQKIAQAYFDVLSTHKVIAIYENARGLIKESLRVNQSLFANDKVNRLAVLRNEQDLKKIEADIQNAQRVAKNAAAYLNFLINQPLETPIVMDSLVGPPTLAIALQENAAQRTELEKINTAVKINSKLIDLANTYRKPELNAFVDLGIQDFDFNVDERSFYAFGGISMRLNLWDGRKGQAAVRKEQHLAAARAEELENTRQLLTLELFNAQNDWQKAMETYRVSTTDVALYQKSYQESLSLYKNGKINYIALLESRNDLIEAELNSSLSLFDTWNKHAQLLRSAALPFDYKN